MKNIALSLLILITVSACSSGTTVADTPFNITGTFSGTFVNAPDTQDGTLQLNLFEDNAGNVTGTAIFDSNGSNCLLNGIVSGSTSSFNASLEVDQAGTLTTIEIIDEETDPDTGEVTTQEDVITTVEEITATLTFILTQSNNGNTLSGTYISVGETCSNATGSGSVTLSR